MIITRLSGGMGNQMFQYALGRVLSTKYKVPLGLDLTFLLERIPRPSWWKFVFRNYDLDVFNISAEIIQPSKIPLIYRPYFFGKLMIYFDAFRRKFCKPHGTEKSFQFDPTVFSLGPDTYLQGDWQSPKYFESIADVIRQEFTLKKPLSEKSKRLMDEISTCTSVCINVRRTDFVGHSTHGTIGREYYDKAIKLIIESHLIDKIYIFSDDLEWCKERLFFDFPTMLVGYEYAGKKFEEYLMLMSACKHFIISNSTFAWWAAWLSPDPSKMVITPRQWFIDENINTNDLIPTGWLRI